MAKKSSPAFRGRSAVTPSSSRVSLTAHSSGVSPGSIFPPGPFTFPAPIPRSFRISSTSSPRTAKSKVALISPSHPSQSTGLAPLTPGTLPAPASPAKNKLAPGNHLPQKPPAGTGSGRDRLRQGQAPVGTARRAVRSAGPRPQPPKTTRRHQKPPFPKTSPPERQSHPDKGPAKSPPLTQASPSIHAHRLPTAGTTPRHRKPREKEKPTVRPRQPVSQGGRRPASRPSAMPVHEHPVEKPPARHQRRHRHPRHIREQKPVRLVPLSRVPRPPTTPPPPPRPDTPGNEEGKESSFLLIAKQLVFYTF